ncbi:class I SAM-dependent methyltransferase [Paractinoplanes rishiriensis]|uniref:Ubiquinone/menaquinone biosynthesis methyltransferase n=1 Tax=Paractinoplanes rishiriensis TaxID=1050105 RepID=A0A919MYK9_9ACTN|nr:methyltransferase domain-containing protein [Actinoplanes rishiriensis]GIF00045.1 ubiquinone/menaquinone biosynthesis methyltransferase [Actinoplanes rishiriensis]
MRYQLTASEAEFYETTFVPALFAAWAQRLIDAVRPQPGESVLDVACGTGAVARLASELAGPVVGLDLNESMLAVARKITPSVHWQQGDACALPFPPASFDVVLSQAALMFVDDRVLALREMGRVSRGRIAVQVPGRLSASAGYRPLAEVVARHADPALLGAYFAVGSPSVLRGLFEDAGLTVDDFVTWTGATRLDSLETFLAVELLPVADRVSPAVRERIVDECRVAMAPFVDPSGAVAAPIEVHLVLGHRS